MINFFSRFKIIFYLINFCLVFLYLFPGSLIGLIIYDDKKIQPQITSDFLVSSNHFYVFTLISVIGFLSFIKMREIKGLIVYLIFLGIFLEILHLIIPERSFQWSDLFGNLLGVFIVILINNLINKYGLFKK
tara:strand:- start:1116 stop:1511 length:396 start_codon:yes stop_codon:yes gene_type:complete